VSLEWHHFRPSFISPDLVVLHALFLHCVNENADYTLLNTVHPATAGHPCIFPADAFLIVGIVFTPEPVSPGFSRWVVPPKRAINRPMDLVSVPNTSTPSTRHYTI
jgi:hypothetical protein